MIYNQMTRRAILTNTSPKCPPKRIDIPGNICVYTHIPALYKYMSVIVIHAHIILHMCNLCAADVLDEFTQVVKTYPEFHLEEVPDDWLHDYVRSPRIKVWK